MPYDYQSEKRINVVILMITMHYKESLKLIFYTVNRLVAGSNPARGGWETSVDIRSTGVSVFSQIYSRVSYKWILNLNLNLLIRFSNFVGSTPSDTTHKYHPSFSYSLSCGHQAHVHICSV